MYEVLWVRYLSLIFGGSNLAVTTVLTVFMGGLALGSYTIGKRVEHYKKLFRLYGFLELGIALSALAFIGLIRFYPTIYIPLARINVTSPVYLSFIRVSLAALALILPTTLMGGTLPVLSSFISSRAKGLGSRLSFLYGLNTIGAFAGAAVTGFVLLPNYSVSATIRIAVLINAVVGILAIFIQDKAQAVLGESDSGDEAATDAGTQIPGLSEKPGRLFSLKLVLWGIGVSGFCSLAYEVLWTRILSIVIGATVYGFTLLLMAFLAGIGIGSTAYGLFRKLLGRFRRETEGNVMKATIAFGLVQVIIGAAALLVSLHIRDLPTHAAFIYNFFQKINPGIEPFKIRQLANFVLAFSFIFVPAFFMGVAFPLAVRIHGQYKKLVGHAVGEILSYNTIGAILGSAVSGFLLIYLLGIQRSLQIIFLVNIGVGLLVIVSVKGKKMLNWGVLGTVMVLILVQGLNPNLWKLWDPHLYAVYQSNRSEMFSTPERARESMKQFEVLYYGEGVQAIVSSVMWGNAQVFITNGRAEASTDSADMQLQYTLGHLPMLLAKNPKKVFVLGTGSGMTLGATSAHPSVEQITLAEIEPEVLGVAKTFGFYNHYVMNNPKLKIVFNDGRNFLMTTKEKFDVITADPIHPWFSGAGYLYSTEYFRLAAKHLNPGGMVCHWLPLYELTEDNLKSVVRTFRKNFPYTMMWLTLLDAALVGSNSPIVIDENELERRIKEPQVLMDLKRVKMGSSEDFLSYFLMGDTGMKAYSSGGRINTDNNLYLEFSAPHNIQVVDVSLNAVKKLLTYRGSILPYLQTPVGESGRIRQKKVWEENLKAATLFDQAHVMFIGRLSGTLGYKKKLMADLDARYPTYAPWRFMKDRAFDDAWGIPTALQEIDFYIINETGQLVKGQFFTVLLRSSEERARVFFIDSYNHIVFGDLIVQGANKDVLIANFVDDVTKSVQKIYNEEQKISISSGKAYPSVITLYPKIESLVELKVEDSKI